MYARRIGVNLYLSSTEHEKRGWVCGAMEACPSHILKHRLAVHVAASHNERACSFAMDRGVTHI